MPHNIISPLREIDCKFNSRLKIFPDFVKVSCFSSDIFNPNHVEKHKTYKQELKEYEFLKQYGKAKRAYSQNDTPRSDSVKRARDKAYEIAFSNDFKYFITLTLDKEKCDRYDTKEIVAKLKVWLSNKVSRNDLKYLIFPEYHSLKDGEEKQSIHFHGLCTGDLNLLNSGKLTRSGQVIFNCESWGFGFSTVVIELTENYSRVVNYVMKYISKDKEKIFGKFYFSGGKNLSRSVPTEYFSQSFEDFTGECYKIPFVPLSVKYKTIAIENGEFENE